MCIPIGNEKNQSETRPIVDKVGIQIFYNMYSVKATVPAIAEEGPTVTESFNTYCKKKSVFLLCQL